MSQQKANSKRLPLPKEIVDTKKHSRKLGRATLSKPNSQNPNHVKSQWDTYRVVMPKDAGATQIIETRRAFYAGAQALLHLMLKKFEPGLEETENDLQMMDDIDAELR